MNKKQLKKVLWVEDNPEQIQNFRKLVEFNGIELVHFRDSENAIKYMESNIEELCAAILDIESYSSANSSLEDKTSFYRVRDCITSLRHRNPIKYFAFTGKGKYIKEQDDFKNQYQCEIFDKNNETSKALNYLLELVEEHPLSKIALRHSWIIAIPDDGIRREIIEILLDMDNNGACNPDIFNKVRKVMDRVMRYCYENCINAVHFNGSNLSECSKFIGKNEMTKFVPFYIQRSFHSVVAVSNDGSHGGLPADDDVKNGIAPYLVSSTVLELLNILFWLKDVPVDDMSKLEREEYMNALK